MASLSKEHSLKISLLKFLLCIGVVMIHCQINPMSWSEIVGGQNVTAFTVFQKVFANIILDNSCVPIFYTISGYFLFFRNQTSYSIADYKSKLNSRFKGIFLPFLIANSIYVIWFRILPSFKEQTFDIHVLYDVITSYWMYESTGLPINGPLWYMRDLMVLILLSPLIYHSVRLFGKYLVCGLFLAMIFLDQSFVESFHYHLYPIAFVSLGCYIAIGCFDFVSFFKIHRLRLVYLLSYLAIILTTTYIGVSRFEDSFEYNLLIRLCQITSLPFAVSLVSFIKQTYAEFVVSHDMVTASFFVFLYHYSFQIPARIYHHVSLHNTCFEFIIYFVGCFIEIAILLCIYYMLKKKAPKIASYIVGGR